MFDIMAFFAGSPDGSVKGRDDLAEIIAKRGREQAVNHWRKEDMRSFTLLLVLEVSYNPFRSLVMGAPTGGGRSNMTKARKVWWRVGRAGEGKADVVVSSNVGDR